MRIRTDVADNPLESQKYEAEAHLCFPHSVRISYATVPVHHTQYCRLICIRSKQVVHRRVAETTELLCSIDALMLCIFTGFLMDSI